MIHPHAEVVDLDAPLWGDISVAVQQSREKRAWAYVLHCDGTVVNTVPGGLRSAPIGEPAGDPVALARAVREETGRVRAVVLDERGLDDLVVRATATAREEQTLAELRAGVADLYWASPAVASDPAEPPDDPQLRLRQALREAAPRQTALLRVLRGGEFGAAVVLTLEDGLITRCVCTDESEAERLSGSAELSADVEWAALTDAIGAVDPWAEFAALLDAAPRQRGLEAVRRALRGQAAAVR